MDLVHDRDADRIEKIGGLLDEVKQLRAEGERLKGELAVLRINHPFGQLYNALCKSQAGLARERELNQGLREVVIGMRSVIDGAGDVGFFDTDRAASLVIKADLLLEPAPVATGEGDQ